MADVTTTFFANEQAAASAIARLEKKYNDLENAIKNVSKRSKEDQSGIADSIGKWGSGLTSIAAGYLALPAIIGAVSAAQSELNRKADEAALKYDSMIRKFRIQAGLTELQGGEAKAKIVRAAASTATDASTAEQVSRQMVSQGFSTEDATGGGLQRILETMKATNAKPEQATEIVSAYAALLAATGQEKNQANLEKITRQVQGTFQASPLEAADLQALAPKIQGVSGVLSPEEALAQFATIKGKTGKADTAATTLKMFWEKLGTADTNQQSIDALSKLGLSPDKVDAIGETPAEVLDRLSAGLDKLKPEQRQGVMKQLFGEEAMSGATGLIRDRAMVPEFIDKMDNEEGFQEAAATGMQGKAAGRERAKLQSEVYDLAQDTGREDYLAALESIQKEEGYSGFRRGVNEYPLRGRLNLTTDQTPEAQLGVVAQAVPSAAIQRLADERGMGSLVVGSENYQKIAEELIVQRASEMQGQSAAPDEYAKLMKENNELLRQMLEDQKKRRDNPQRKPAGE